MTSYRLLLRLGMRSIRRAPLRSLLVFTLIALLVGVGTTTSIIATTAIPTDEDRVQAMLGDGDVLVVSQSPRDTDRISSLDAPKVSELEDLVGGPVVANRTISTFGGGAPGPFLGLTDVRGRVSDLDLTHPLAQGTLVVIEGRLPEGIDEVAIASRQRDLDAQILGASVRVSGRPMTVVGVVRDPVSGPIGISLITPRTMDNLIVQALDDGALDEPLNLQLELRLQTDQTVPNLLPTISKALDARTYSIEPDGSSWFADADGVSERPSVDPFNPLVERQIGPAIVPLLLMLVLGSQVVLVSAAAFTIGAQRKTRDFGQLIATGADSSHLRGIVLIEAALLGVTGALAGVALGLGAATQLVDLRFIGSTSTRYFESMRFDALDLVLPAVLGVVAAVLAALVPARTASRLPVLGALANRTPTRESARYAPSRGIAAFAIGAVVLAGGSGNMLSASLGIAAMLGGALLLIGWVIQAAARSADRLPLLPRLVLRNSDRHRSRSSASIAAFVPVLVLPVLLGASVAAYPGSYGAEVLPRTANRLITVTSAQFNPDSYASFDDTLQVAMRETVGPVRSAALELGPRVNALNGGPVASRALVATPELVELLDLDRDLISQLDERTLVDLSADQRFVGATSVSIIRDTGAPFVSDENELQIVAGEALLPRFEALLVAPSFSALGTTEPRGVLYLADEPFTRGQEQAFRSAADSAWLDHIMDPQRTVTSQSRTYVQQFPIQTSVYRVFNSGPTPSQVRWVSLAISAALAALIATIIASLSAVEVDRELQTMITTGAEPRTRRLLLGGQTLYHLAIAAAIAVPLGLGIFAAATLSDANAPGLTLPWGSVASAAFVIPIVVSCVVGLLFRSGAPALSRRIA